MLRKVCAVAVASVLAAGCLTACGRSKNTGPLTLDQIKENGKLTVATDIRFMWLLQDEPPPSHMTIDNFMIKEK